MTLNDAQRDLDAKQMRRRMLLYYARDGLWDICVGICVLGWALALRFDFIALVGVIIAGTASVVPAVRKKVTYPRIGYARLKPDSGTRQMLALLVAFGLSALMLVLLAGTGLRELIRTYIEVWLGVMGALLIAVLGYLLNTSRFYVYAMLVFLAGAATQWAGVELWLAVAVAGASIIAAGIVVLCRFLRDNPSVADEQNG